MNSIAMQALAIAPRDTAQTSSAVKSLSPVSSVAAASDHTAAGRPELLRAVPAVDQKNQTETVAARRTSTAIETKQAEGTEKEQSRASGTSQASEGPGMFLVPKSLDDDPLAPDQPRPAPPLKTYARIPTTMMLEIGKLREAAAETNAKTVEGRQDPTPMPAGNSAIGGAE